MKQENRIELKITRFNFYYTLAIFIFLILGLVNTIYLSWSHYKNYTDLTFNSFCALSQTINCDTVSQSPWSVLLGLPLAYWGLFAYTLFLTIFLAALCQKNGSEYLWYILCALGIAYSVAAVSFSYISTVKIKAHCILCLASHTISFALFFFSWIILRRSFRISFPTGLNKGFQYLLNSPSLLTSFLVLLTGLTFLKLNIPPYWLYTLPSSPLIASTGLTEDGNPWIGAENPTIIIHEYADYQCFQCSKMHLFLRQLTAENTGTIKLVHHHYPMDHEFNSIIVPRPFHIGSGKMAMIGIYAASKNKFWEMNDALYAMGREKQAFSTRKLAERSGFTSTELAAAIQHPQIREALLYDIRQGMKLGITGTPSYVIDGKVYQGTIPSDILRKIVQ